MGKYDKLAHRRASKVIKVVDASGAPVANTKMRLRQTNHEFLFGSGAFDINEFFLTDDPAVKAKMQERIDIWLELFNYGTPPVRIG